MARKPNETSPDWPAILLRLREYQRTIGDAMLRDLHYDLLTYPELNYPNTKNAQKRLSEWTIRWRDGGELDYTKFIDTQRDIHNRFALLRRSVQDVVDGVINDIEEASKHHYIPRQEAQPSRLIMLCEKEGRSRHLTEISNRYSVPLVSSKGYSSYTVLRKDLRDIFNDIEKGTPVMILAITDFDPSGVDMVRDLRSRLTEFYKDYEITVDKVCLTIEQVKHYNLPEMPANNDDNRKRGFQEEYGENQGVVELNALPVPEFKRIIEEAVRSRFDNDVLREILADEKRERKEIEEKIKERLDNRKPVSADTDTDDSKGTDTDTGAGTDTGTDDP